jgi:transposase
MYAVEVYAAVRQFVFIEGNSKRKAARVFGLARETVDKICAFSVPPGYQRRKPPEKRKLGAFLGLIDAILVADLSAPPKQRHTSKRIFERLREEHGFAGGYTVVKDYVRQARVRSRETFVPLAHPPGQAQADFGEALAVIGGRRQKIHFFCLDLPYSDACFVKAYLSETTEAFLDGHVSAFAFFGHVPQSVLYDNTRIAVKKITGDGVRVRTKAFSELVSHYLFRDRFGRPGKGNDKGKVEALVKYTKYAVVPARRRRWDDTVRASLNGWLPIWPRCGICLRFPWRPATSVRRGSVRPRWCDTKATTTRCRRGMASRAFW